MDHISEYYIYERDFYFIFEKLFRELLEQKGAFSEFLTQHIQDIDDDEGN